MRRFVKWLKGDSNSRSWVRRKAVACWMNVLIAIAAAVAVVTAGLMSGQPWPAPHTLGIGALRLFTLWCLAFLPGWLYVRFLDLRALALWNEYVLNLYRLGWDTPSNLPEPSVDPAADNIYQQKFEAYYGRQITQATRDRQRTPEQKDYRVSSESLFPVFLATAVFAVGWAAVLWDTRFVTDPSGPWDVVKYGFLGAYAFVTSMLIRRFFQSDLRPSAYATAVFRIILVLLIIVVLHQVMDETSTMAYRGELAVAFVVGFFPLVGLQFLQRVTSKVLGLIVPPVTPAYPLDQLDGFNLWYEARLTEEGVEDMQNLTTMNLVDVILHTRVPPGRLVDWTDQAFLLTHLEQAGRRQLTRQRKSQGAAGYSATEGDAEPGVQARLNLRRVGIRTATDLLKAFSEPAPEPGAPWRRDFSLGGIKKSPPLPEDQLRLLVKVLAEEPGLNPVWNWQRNGVQLSQVPFRPGPRSLHAPAA